MRGDQWEELKHEQWSMNRGWFITKDGSGGVRLTGEIADIFGPGSLRRHRSRSAASGPRSVEVEMAIEGEITQADDGGAEIWAMAFDGSVQGPFIAEHECDYIELILTTLNSNAIGHNINFHTSTVAISGGFRLSLRAGRGDRPDRQRPS
jgi:hypothetical protein